MAETVNKILKMDDEKTKRSPVVRVASDQRIIEHWNSLWNHWDGLVLDVGDEEGKYAVQEEHWDPLYFDGSVLADELDPIAADMLRLIDDVYDLVKNPDLFSDALDKIGSNIASYPEWMGVESDEGCILGINATSCILKWLWLSARNNAHPGKTFLDKVYEIEDNYSMVRLDENECIDFFEKLPDEVCREIYACFKNDDLRDNLDNVHSSWHRINHLYIDPLFAQWENEISQRSLPYTINVSPSSDTWIHWLIEAELDITGKREWFMEKLNTWLAHLKKNTNVFVKQWQWFARLTKDMPESDKLKKQYPTFFKIVLPEDSGISILRKKRCNGLQKMGAGSCLSKAMDIWIKHLCSIVPDPANTYKSDYTYHAQWMKALYELSHDEYNVMLAQWREKHKRRRNLWQYMKSHRLPV